MTLRLPLTFFLILFSIAAVAAPPSGVVTTVAGQPGLAGYWDGPATDAMFTHPTWLDVAVGAAPPTCDEGRTGEIFVVDRMNGVVRRISESGFVSTVNVGTTSFVGGPVVTPIPLDFDSAFGGGILIEPPGAGCGCGVYGRGMFIASTGANQILLVSPTGALAARDDWTPIIGPGQVQFNHPTGVAFSSNGDIPSSSTLHRKVYVADSGNHAIRTIQWVLSFEACPQGRGVTTLAGSPGQPGSADGAGSAARFNTPRGLAATADSTVYVADAGNHTIRRITPDGTVTTIAGVPGVAGSDDGPALQAHLRTPSGIDINDRGELFIVDTFNHAIRMLTTDGKLITVAGQLGVSGFADGDAVSAKFNAPVGLKIAPDGSIVIADTGNNVIRRLTFK